MPNWARLAAAVFRGWTGRGCYLGLTAYTDYKEVA
jgi:hypothetical protein